MHQLVPELILSQYAAGRRSGDAQAVGLFVDISGFSTITDALMAHGQQGAEVMANIMRDVWEPVLAAVHAHGGFVASSAGDALTVLFLLNPSEMDAGTAPISLESPILHGLAAAQSIHDSRRARAIFDTPYQAFRLSAKVGLALGWVHWAITGDEGEQHCVYYFNGPVIDGCAEAEHYARAGEIILDARVMELARGWVEAVPIDLASKGSTPGGAAPLDLASKGSTPGGAALLETSAFYRVLALKGELPGGAPYQPPEPDLEVMRRFYPEALITQSYSGEFRQVVNLFINLPSVRLEAQLKIFMERLFSLQERFGGLLSRLDFGDKGTNILLFWGAPVAYENDIERALNFILELQTITSLPISAGVTYRISHAGFIGSRLYEEFTCSGRGVNLAARFMTSAPRGEIWVDEPVARRAEKRFVVERVGEKSFKGFAQPQKVYALLEAKDSTEGFFSGALVGRAAELECLARFTGPIFAGRPAGLMVIAGEPGIGKSRLVDTFLRQASAENPQLQVFVGQVDAINRESFAPWKYWLRHYFGISGVQGEARSKRSFNRKLDELIAATFSGGQGTAGGSTATFSGGQGTAGGSTATFSGGQGTAGGSTATFSGGQGTASGSTAAPEQALAEELDRTRSFLGALIDLEWPDSLYEQLDAQGRYKNTFIALAALLQAESLRAPLALVLEDIHAQDEDSWAFLRYLLHLLALGGDPAYPIAILSTSRERAAALPLKGLSAPDDLAVAELALEGLDRAGLQRLAEGLLEHPLAGPLLDLLEARAEGNPFYAEQILRYLREDGRLALHKAEPREVAGPQGKAGPLAEGWTIDPRQGQALPEDVNALLVARLDHLDRAVREVVQTAAVLGREFEVRLLNGMLQPGELAHLPAEVEIAEREAIWSPLSELRYIFRHILMRDAAYQMQVRARRERLHGLALEAYERLYSGRLDEVYEALGYHAEQAGRRVKARLYLRLAGQRALDAYQNGPAEDFFTRALAVSESPAERYALLLARESVYERMGRQPERLRDLDALDALLPLLNEDDKRVEVALRRVRYLRESGQVSEGVAAGQAALELAEQAGLVLQAAVLLRALASLALDQSRHAQAEQLCRRSLELARQAGAVEEQYWATNMLGLILLGQGRLPAATDYFTQALEIAQKENNRLLLGPVLNNLGRIAGSQGNYPAAMEYYTRSLESYRQTGIRSGEGIAQSNIGFLYGEMGQFQKACGYLERALRLGRETGSLYVECYTLINLSAFTGALGEHETAERYARQAQAQAQKMGDRSGEAWALTYLGHSLLARGGAAGAGEGAAAPGNAANAAASVAAAASTDATAFAEADSSADAAASAASPDAAAADAYAGALKIRQEIHQPDLACEPAAGLARAALRRGDTPAARAYLQPVLDYLDAGGSLDGADEPLRVYLTLYLVLRQAGDARAAGLLETAARLLDERASRITDEAARRAFLENIEHHREIRAALGVL